MKALGLVVLDKKIFDNCILKTYFLTLWTTYALVLKFMSNAFDVNWLDKISLKYVLIMLLLYNILVLETIDFGLSITV